MTRARATENDKKNRPEANPGQIAPGVAIDRNILKRTLGSFRPAQLTIGYSGQLDPIVLEDDSREWRILLMPMRDQPLGDLPALLATGAAQ